ncbi:hypothetical protein ACO2Q1_16255 [Brevundimonas sp. VNH65]|uniref:hypothetical protein n=1 Tax=Brevundimonas sp. VNH65 TaxID=3400917 RepID=UPI003BFB0C79
MKQEIQTFTIDWQGVALSVTYNPAAFGGATAHIEIHVLSPARAPLPITETGYRSHFLPPVYVEDAGGPVAYVLAWLDQAAQSREWRDHVERSRQGSLF